MNVALSVGSIFLCLYNSNIENLQKGCLTSRTKTLRNLLRDNLTCDNSNMITIAADQLMS